ncbi:MAG: terminase family protein [Chloroflexota bacterium]
MLTNLKIDLPTIDLDSFSFGELESGIDVSMNLPELHPKQVEMWENRKRFNTVAAGRRIGKTTFGSWIMGQPEYTDYPIGWFAPSYKILIEIWREAKRIFHDVIERKSEVQKRIELATGGVIEFWSLDNPDAARGRKYKLIIIDEAAMISKLMDAWNLVLRPTLVDYIGEAWFFSTPKGRNGFWKMYQWGLDERIEDWASFQAKTIDNPFIDPSEVEAAKLTTPDMFFRQEYLAEFLEDAGGVFRNVIQCATAEEQHEPADGVQYCFGVDWGKLNDFTVISIIDVTNRRLVKQDSFNQIDYNFQLARLKSLYDIWRPVNIYAEKNSMGEALIDQLYSEGLPVYPMNTTNATKDAWIQSLSIAFERGEIEIINDPVLIGELQAFEATRTRSGLMSYSAPEGMHDDRVMSLAMGWQGATYAGELAGW